VSEPTNKDRPSADVIFCAALEIHNPDARAAYLDEVCNEDGELRLSIEKLLDAHGRAGKFLECTLRTDALL